MSTSIPNLLPEGFPEPHVGDLHGSDLQFYYFREDLSAAERDLLLDEASENEIDVNIGDIVESVRYFVKPFLMYEDDSGQDWIDAVVIDAQNLDSER